MAAYRESMNVHEKAPVSPRLPHSPWHSPVPYMFGGLAAMFGLIAFALLMLACSYWKISGYLENNNVSERDLEAGEGETEQDQKPQKPYEERIMVIMAGQEKPTFLATPTSSVGASSSSTCRKSVEMTDHTAVKQGSCGGQGQVRTENMENPEICVQGRSVECV